MGDNGLIITAKDGEDNTNLFTVQKETTDEQGRPIYEKYIYVNSAGEVVIAGNSVLVDDKPLIEYIDDVVDEEITLPVTVQIDSSAGNIFKNGGIYSILTATVYLGGEDITDQVERFFWTKRDRNGDLDPSWSRYTTSNVITISDADVFSKAIFGCEVTIQQ